MKVPGSVRALYRERLPYYAELENRVATLFEGRKDSRWHYEGRVKSEQSFALKLETGRVPDPTMLDDFFACTLVVSNGQEVLRATKLVEEVLEVTFRRPQDPRRTHKISESFPFDDLRLYCRWRSVGRPTGLEGLTFEVQVKTFLQHAWGIATHDLIYKNNEKNWGKERIAYQLKAMLEHAEVAIQQASLLATSDGLAVTNEVSEEISTVIAWLRSTWSQESQLPENQKLLAENVRALARFASVPLDECLALVSSEAQAGLPTNISPYGFVLDVLLRKRVIGIRNGFAATKGPNAKFVLVVPAEIAIPDALVPVPAGRLVRLMP